jgi:hypothetical protein
MKTYKREVKTILFHLKGCAWATHGDVQNVIVEYTHLNDAAKTPTGPRRVSLQIFHAARAIDTLLAHIANHEGTKCGRAVPRYWTLGSSLREIQTHGVGGLRFSGPTKIDIEDMTDSRNTYLHQANCFPNDQDMQVFINKTIRAILEAAAFPP